MHLAAQDTLPVSNENDDVLEEKIEIATGNTDDETDYTALYEDLEHYKKHPLRLNEANREELHRLGVLLSELQINALLQHIEKNGELLALYELQAIDGFDLETINRILPYITVNETTPLKSLAFSQVMQDGNHTAVFRTEKVLETAAGYARQKDGYYNSGYLGSPFKIYSRYCFNYQNRIRWGITGEKDAGEEWFTGSQKNGFDFYSAHFHIRDVGIVKAFSAGDYQLQYGQGLALWSGLTFGKTPDVINIKKYGDGILPYTSADENIFFRGAAAAFALKNFQWNVFYSKNNIDANITGMDTVSNEITSVSSLQTSGYHRTFSELKDKDAMNLELYGTHLLFRTKKSEVGITGVKTIFGADLQKTPQVYNRFDFKGNTSFNYSMDYSYVLYNLNFFGEAAGSQNGGTAYLNGLLVNMDSRLAVSLLHRNYQKNYQTLWGKGFSEATHTQNEQGLYVGLSAKPLKRWTLALYYDVFHFPWLKYQIDAPSGGTEYFAQLTYTPSKQTELYLRYKNTVKQNNASSASAPLHTLVDIEQQNFRISCRYKISPSFTLASRVELSSYHKVSSKQSGGYVVFQDITYKTSRNPVSFSFRYALFDTDTYDSRIYAYEHDVLYSFSIPAYYYRGSRMYLTTSCKLKKGVDVWLRYEQTVYNNRKTVSSGLNEIQGNTKSMLKAQIRLEF